MLLDICHYSDSYVLIRGNEKHMLDFAEQSKRMVMLTGKKRRKKFNQVHPASFMPFHRPEISSLVRNRIDAVSKACCWSRNTTAVQSNFYKGFHYLNFAGRSVRISCIYFYIRSCFQFAYLFIHALIWIFSFSFISLFDRFHNLLFVWMSINCVNNCPITRMNTRTMS